MSPVSTQASTFKVLLSNAAASQNGSWAKPSNSQRTHNHDTHTHPCVPPSPPTLAPKHSYVSHVPSHTHTHSGDLSAGFLIYSSLPKGIFLSFLQHNFLINQCFLCFQNQNQLLLLQFITADIVKLGRVHSSILNVNAWTGGTALSCL